MVRNLIPGGVTIRSVKPGDTRKRLSNGEGLYLRLFVNGGAHSWRLDYTVNGVRKNLSLGTYPATGLALARDKADKARALVAAGIDPGDTRKADKVAQAERRQAEQRQAARPAGCRQRSKAVARDWLAVVHSAKVSAGHAECTCIRFEPDGFPWLGARQVGEIDTPELLACLRRVLARGAGKTAHRIKDACGQVFRYAIASGLATRNPAADLRQALPPVPTRHHAAIIDPGRMGELLRAIDAYKGG